MDKKLAAMIDHTILKPEATAQQIEKLCSEAKEYGFFSVCINPVYVSLAAGMLKNSEVKVCTVVGFPLGACTTKAKAFETEDAIANGAQEIDMVIHVGAMKNKNYDYVLEDIKAVVNAASGKALVKVILENCLLEKDEIAIACSLCKKAGANYVKTSTGFNKSGAAAEDIKIMRETVGTEMGVKAAGGIRDYATAKVMVDAGASRIGASESIKIVNGD